jgi:DNA-binding transcriptional MerR regulator
MEWSIQELAKLAGTTSRTLRHYDEVQAVIRRPARR